MQEYQGNYKNYFPKLQP